MMANKNKLPVLAAALFCLALAANEPEPVESFSILTHMLGNTIDYARSAFDSFSDILEETTFDATQKLDETFKGPQDPDKYRNVSEIIRSRGFHAEEYDVVTKDGYILTIQRIVNPMVKAEFRPKMKPVILQHGLLSSSVDWVINSLHVKPSVYPPGGAAQQDSELESNKLNRWQEQPAESLQSEEILQQDEQQANSSQHDSQEHPNSLGFYLANKGYDVFLANSRGNLYGQRHVSMSAWNPKFWDFTFDEQIDYDLPDTIAFVQNLTGHTKVGYVGHSQGTLMAFGLLSDRPEYSDIIEPVVALAPVAYVNNAISPAKYFSVYTPVFSHVNMWFGSSNAAIRYLAPKVCSPKIIEKGICANILFLSVGFDEAELDESRVPAYLAHMPSGTSVKNIAHYGQEVISGRFARFEHGILANLIRYRRTKSPDYDLGKIRSKSLVLFIAENDWLASPKDVARLRAELKVEPYAVYNMTKFLPNFNHIDFVYGKDAGELVNTRIFEAMERFRGV